MLTRRLFRLSLFLPVLLLAGAEPAKKEGTLRLNLRTRVEPFKGSGAWEEVVLRKELPGNETAVILCDVWDRHWCESASRRSHCPGQKGRSFPSGTKSPASVAGGIGAAILFSKRGGATLAAVEVEEEVDAAAAS